MKKQSMIIVLVILITTSLFSQNLSVTTLYSPSDSLLTIKSNHFGISQPLKARFNDSNAVLISEKHMDSINIKYLNYNLVFSQKTSLENQIELLLKEGESTKITINYLKQDNQNLKSINDNQQKYIDNTEKIHEHEILYLKEKSKGKFRSFILGTSVGATLIILITSIL
jgi:hypothetical protein